MALPFPATALGRSLAAALAAVFVGALSTDWGPPRLRSAPERIPDARVAAALAVEQCGVLRPPADKFACYEAVFAGRLRAVGIRDALATLRAVTEADADAARDGHVYAHGIGIAAYRLHPSVARSFPDCTTAFASGCYHGVIQAHLNDQPRVGRQELLALCEPYRGPDARRWLLFQCLHGAGHGLTMHHGHELPRALADCEQFPDDWERESCYGGAFMENLMHATAPHHPATRLAAGSTESHWRPLDSEDPLYPCSVMPPQHRRSCYLLQTSLMLQSNGGDLASAARGCDRAPSDMREPCYRSLGRDVSGYAGQDPGQAIALCGLGSRAYWPACYFGAVKSLIDWAASTSPGFRMCRMVAERGGKEACYLAIGEQIAALYPDAARRRTECAAAESPRFAGVCRDGARVGA